MDKVAKRAALKMLRQLYGFDVAMLKQQGTDFGDEISELESLALYHLNRRIVESVVEFSSLVGDQPDMESGAVSVLMGSAGDLLARMELKHGKRLSGKAARFGKKYLEMQYMKRLGEKQ